MVLYRAVGRPLVSCFSFSVSSCAIGGPVPYVFALFCRAVVGPLDLWFYEAYGTTFMVEMRRVPFGGLFFVSPSLVLLHPACLSFSLS